MTASCSLEDAEFFRALAPQALESVRDHLRERKIRAREILFLAGEPAEALWVVARGEVRLYKSSVEGKETTLETLGPGQAFGALAALGDEPYPASAEATAPGTVWCLPRSRMRELLQADPQVAVEVLRIVSGRLHDAHERLRSLAQDPAPARLARALLEASHEGEAVVTRRALAEIAGTTVETAIRALRRFEREGLVRGEVGRIHVVDEPSLRRLAGTGD